MRQVLEWGVDERRRDPRPPDAGGLQSGPGSSAFEAPPTATRAVHYLGLKMKGGVPPEGLLAKLAELRKVYVSVRGTSIRVTPHAYNDESRRRAVHRTLSRDVAENLSGLPCEREAVVMIAGFP